MRQATDASEDGGGRREGRVAQEAPASIGAASIGAMSIAPSVPTVCEPLASSCNSDAEYWAAPSSSPNWSVRARTPLPAQAEAHRVLEVRIREAGVWDVRIFEIVVAHAPKVCRTRRP